MLEKCEESRMYNSVKQAKLGTRHIRKENKTQNTRMKTKKMNNILQIFYKMLHRNINIEQKVFHKISVPCKQ
jgi:hypothetical protein